MKTKKPIEWGCSSAGRAPALQAGGHGFESHHLHQESERIPLGSSRILFDEMKGFEKRRHRGNIRWMFLTAGDQGAQFAPRPNPIIGRSHEGNELQHGLIAQLVRAPA